MLSVIATSDTGEQSSFFYIDFTNAEDIHIKITQAQTHPLSADAHRLKKINF